MSVLIQIPTKIRKMVGPDVTIIIMTAYDWAGIERDAKLAGVNLLMSKTMFKSSLISAFEKALGKQVEESTQLKDDFKFDEKRILLAEDHPLNVEVAKRLGHKKVTTTIETYCHSSMENQVKIADTLGKVSKGEENAM